MDITVTWASPTGQLITDEYDVLYKVWESAGLNNWILANPTPLPSTTTTYTITGLDPNTIYRVAVTKSCIGTASYVDEAKYVDIVCPLISFWQGPQLIRGEQTLFYSINYPDATHLTNTEILVYDISLENRFLEDCGSGPVAMPIGRTSYIVTDGCAIPSSINCNKQILDFTTTNSGISATSYFGLDTTSAFNSLCNGSDTDPIMLRAGNTYAFQIFTIIDQVSLGVTIDYTNNDTSCQVIGNAPTYIMPGPPALDTTFLTTAVCWDSVTGKTDVTTVDGTGQIDAYYYWFDYTTQDNSGNSLELVNTLGNPVHGSNIEYYVYCPIDMTPSLLSTQISSQMNIIVNIFNPGSTNILTLTGVNYSGFIMADVCRDIASALTSVGYSSSYINISGTDYIKIITTGSSIDSAEIVIGGPDIFGVGTAALPQDNYVLGEATITSAVEYNGYIYGARGLTTTYSNIQATKIADGTTIAYQHTIDYPINQIELVPIAPPAEVYDLKLLQGAGTYSLNVGIDETNGIVYTIDDTHIYAYDITDNSLISSATFVSIDPSITYPYRYVKAIESTNNILLFGNYSGGPTNVDVITFDGVSTWGYSTQFLYSISEYGGIVYNPINNYVYLSIGAGQVIACDSTGIVDTIQLLEPDGITNAIGAHHMAVHSSGIVHVIKRDSTGLACKHIYTISTSNVPGIINGSLYWNTPICGNISFVNDSLFFTRMNIRFLYEFDVVLLNIISVHPIPSVYSKMDGIPAEYAQGAIHLSGTRFLMMNRMNNSNTPTTYDDYQITNLFIYDSLLGVIQPLIGAPNEPYSGSSASWNLNSDGAAFALNDVNINYCYSISPIVSSTGFIYWKPTLNNNIYVSEMYSETGVAQLWAGYSASGAKNLIRIFNIQSDGSLVSSNRNIFQITGSNFGNGLRNMRYDSYYQSVIFNGYLGVALNLFNATTLCGFAGSSYVVGPTSVWLTSVSYDGDGATTGVYSAQNILSNNQGGAAVFGPANSGGNAYGYMNISAIDITTQSPNPTFVITGDGTNSGLYNTDTYPQIHISATATYWVMGNSQYSAGDKIINIYNAASTGLLSLLHTINLTTLGVTIPTIGFSKFVYNASRNEVFLYDSLGNFLAFNINTYLVTLALNFDTITGGSPQNVGTVIDDGAGYYVDISTAASLDEVWFNIGPGSISYTGNTHHFLNIIANITNPIVNLFNVYSPGTVGNYFGQWKLTTDTTWGIMPISGAITVIANDTIEFTMFSLKNTLLEVENTTTSVVFDLASYSNLTTIPTYNTLNSIPCFAIKADSVNLSNGDVLQFTFENADNTSCPFITTLTINF